MNRQILKWIAKRLSLYLAPFLFGVLGWLGLVTPEEAAAYSAKLAGHLGDLIFLVLLLGTGIAANLQHEYARTQAALALPPNSTHEDLERATKRKQRRPPKPPKPPINVTRVEV